MIRVLLLSSRPAEVDALRQALNNALAASTVDVCPSVENAITWIQNRPCDLVAVTGSAASLQEAVGRLRRVATDTALVALLPDGEQSHAGAAWLAGADDVMTVGALLRGDGAERLGRLRQHERDLRRSQRVWFVGPESPLHQQLSVRLGHRCKDVTLTPFGQVTGLTAQELDPGTPAALLVDARVRPADAVLSIRSVREVHPTLPIVVMAEPGFHDGFRRAGAGECVPPSADVDVVRAAIQRAHAAGAAAAELITLRARETRLRALVEYLPEAVMLVGSNHAVLAVNLAGLRLLGAQDAREVIGKTLVTWLDSDDEGALVELVDGVAAGAARELSVRSRHGAEPARLHLRAVPFQREPDRPAASLVVLREAEKGGRLGEPALPSKLEPSADEHAADAECPGTPALSRELAPSAHERAAQREEDRPDAEALSRAVGELDVLRPQLAEAREALAAADRAQQELRHTIEREVETRRALEAQQQAPATQVSTLEEPLAGVRSRTQPIEEPLVRQPPIDQDTAEVAMLREAHERLAALEPEIAELPALREASARLATLEPEIAELPRLRDVERQLEALRADAEDVPALRDARRKLAALEGEAAGVQLIRAQALALEAEVVSLREARGESSRLREALQHAQADVHEMRARAGTAEIALDPESRWLLYDVASIGRMSTTPEGAILSSNDIAARLLGHFSADALQASGVLPVPLLEAAGAFARRPSRFEVCLQHGDEGPLHWLGGLALPQGGVPAAVTWLLVDVSEQRLQARRSRFLRRMDGLTHVLSAATAECTTLVDAGSRVIDAAATALAGREDVDVVSAGQALGRTQAVLTQLAGFARRRARRPSVQELRALIERVAPVLVHVAGEDIIWALRTGNDPLYASIEPAELEQCLTALVMVGREVLPLGGQLTLSLAPVETPSPPDTERLARPEIQMTLQAQGYGLLPFALEPSVHELAVTAGTTLTTSQPDHLTSSVQLVLPRVFITA